MAPPFLEAPVKGLTQRPEVVQHAQGGEVEGQRAPLAHRLPQRQHGVEHDPAGWVNRVRIAATRALLDLAQRAQRLFDFDQEMAIGLPQRLGRLP